MMRKIRQLSFAVISTGIRLLEVLSKPLMMKKPNVGVWILIGCVLIGLSLSCADASGKPATAAAASTQLAGHNFVRWEKSIAALEAKDAADAPPKHAVLFTGASSIVRWKTLAQDFPKYPVINHAFGGS